MSRHVLKIAISGVAVLGSLAGCSGTTTSSGSDAPEKTPPESCQDIIDAYAVATTQCGLTKQETEDAFLQGLGVPCSAITGIRDWAELETCLTKLRAMTCAQVQAGTLDSTCLGQLEH